MSATASKFQEELDYALWLSNEEGQIEAHERQLRNHESLLRRICAVLTPEQKKKLFQ